MFISYTLCIIFVGEDCGADPKEGDDLLSIDGATHVGDKRCLEDPSESSLPPKHQRVSSFSSPAKDSATSFLNSLGKDPAASPSRALQLPPTDPASVSVKMLGASVISPDGVLVPLTGEDIDFMRGVSTERVTLESSQTQAPFMSMRVGSTHIPSHTSNFNKSLGSHIYVPPTSILLRDDGMNPAHARSLINAMTPPLLTLDGEQRTVDELAARQALHSFQAVVSSNLLQRRMEDIVANLRQTISVLQEEKKTIADECSSLKDTLETVRKENDALSIKNSVLVDDVSMRDAALRFKDDDLEKAKLQIDELKAELSRDKQVKEDLIVKVERGDAFLTSFPDVFRTVLDHSDFRVPFNAFNNAVANAGERLCYVNIMKHLQKTHQTAQIPACQSDASKELQRANDVWKAKVFPIVDEIPSLARRMDMPGLLAYLSSPSEPVLGSTSLEAAPKSASASQSVMASPSTESASAAAPESTSAPTLGASESSSALASNLSSH